MHLQGQPGSSCDLMHEGAERREPRRQGGDERGQCAGKAQDDRDTRRAVEAALGQAVGGTVKLLG